MHTFDIRFARSRGLAGFFEAPSNRLGWRGAGCLTIDAKGIDIAVKPRLRALFSRGSRRFSGDSLIEAYREGDSLRLVFRANDKSEFLPIWTDGGDQAAELVKLLPTLRTVEIEQTTLPHRYRPDWRSVSLVAFALMIAGAASLSLLRPSADFPERISEPGNAGNPAREPIIGDHPTDSTDDGARAMDRSAGAAGENVAESARPRGIGSSRQRAEPDYPGAANAGEVGRSPESSAADQSTSSPSSDSQTAPRFFGHADAVRWMLEDFEAQSGNGIDDQGWWEFTVRLHTTPEFQDHELWVIREAMLAVSRAWRAHDAEFAQELTGQVHMLVREAL